jgi:hypothetical protein
MHRKSALIAFVCFGLFEVVGGSIGYLRKSKSPPLGEAPSIEYPSEKMAESAKRCLQQVSVWALRGRHSGISPASAAKRITSALVRSRRSM